MEYLIHDVKFEMCPALNKFPVIFSTVKLKLEHNFSQFINRFKIGTLKSWSQAVLLSFAQFTKRFKIRIFECCSSWTSQFSPIHGRDLKSVFLNISLVLPNISQFTKQFENCGDCLSGRVYVMGRGHDTNYETILQYFKCWKHCLQV